MGARVSIQFKNGDNLSPILFSHWGGDSFVEEANKYVEELKEEVGDKKCYPLERLEAGTVLVDFIRHITKNLKRVDSDLYLEISENNGDNRDYGHHIIELDK